MIVQSDHGHSTEERAFWGGGSAGIYRGAKFSLFEGGIRVPAIMSWPGHLPENEVRSQVAHGCDWLPTIAELCGAKLPAVMLDGKSLAAVDQGRESPVAARGPALADRHKLGSARGRLEAPLGRGRHDRALTRNCDPRGVPRQFEGRSVREDESGGGAPRDRCPARSACGPNGRRSWRGRSQATGLRDPGSQSRDAFLAEAVGERAGSGSR